MSTETGHETGRAIFKKLGSLFIFIYFFTRMDRFIIGLLFFCFLYAIYTLIEICGKGWETQLCYILEKNQERVF